MDESGTAKKITAQLDMYQGNMSGLSADNNETNPRFV
jgi:hypothetical protein